MRKTTLGLELKALNGEEMTLGHKWETMTLGREVGALNEKEMTLGDNWDERLYIMSFGL